MNILKRRDAEAQRTQRGGKGSAIDHPAHYNAGVIEVIDAIEDWSLGFHLGNAVKYIARAEHKGKAVEDLKKAVWYLNREIQPRTSATSASPRLCVKKKGSR